MGAKSRALCTLRIIPLIILLVVFVAWFSYVSWSLHLFIAARPRLLVNCSQMDDPHFLSDYLKNRTVLHEKENSTERMTVGKCWGIKKRWYFPGEVPDTMEVHHPVYYIRIVSQDYAFFEEVFNMFYSPIHFYCYPIAETASESFESKVRFLGDCMLNVIVPPGKFDTSNVTDIFRAHYSCFHRMGGFDWRHMFVSQESQVPLQSVHFYSDVMRRIGSVSKIGHEILTEENTVALGDPNNLEHEESKVSLLRDVCNWLHGKKEILAITRAAAHVFYPLVMNSTLDDCLRPSELEGKCPTGHFDEDHNCVWGMENIKQARKSKSFFVHADPSFDLGFVQCVHDFVHDRTYNPDFYPNVKYGSH